MEGILERILFDPRILILTVISLANGVFGLYILWRNWRGSINRTFCLFLMAMMVWGLIYVPYYTISNLGLAKYLMVCSYLIAIAIGFTFLRFVHIFPHRSFTYPSIVRNLFIVLTGLTLIVILYPGLLVANIINVEGIKFVVLNKLGHVAFASYFLIFSAAIFYTLLRKYAQSAGMMRVQLKSMVIACLIALSWGVFFNLLMPAIGVHEYYWVGPYLTILISFAAIYTIYLCNKIR